MSVKGAGDISNEDHSHKVAGLRKWPERSSTTIHSSMGSEKEENNIPHPKECRNELQEFAIIFLFCGVILWSKTMKIIDYDKEKLC